jgi:hypothetical protein
MIRRPPRSTQSRSSAASDVYKRQNVITDIHPVLSLALGLLISGSVNLVKTAAIRPAVAAGTAGVGNVPVSIMEDVTSTSVSILAIATPVAVAAIIIFFIGWIIWRFVIRPLTSG